MRVAVEPGVELFVQDVGAGRPVVLVAGFGMDHAVWDGEVRALAADHRVVCVDMRGHGLSDKPLSGYDLPRMAADLAAVLGALDLRDVTLAGWSFGGQIAFQLAATDPERLAQLVLVGSNGVRASRSESFPFGQPPGEVRSALIAAEQANRVLARRQTIASGFHAEPDPWALGWLVSRSLQGMPSWAAIACYETMLTADLVDAIPRVTLPVLQVIGTADPVHSARGARWLAAQLPDARLVELAGCGHYPMLEAQAAFHAALLDFVSFT